jgi:hypothetical protein
MEIKERGRIIQKGTLYKHNNIFKLFEATPHNFMHLYDTIIENDLTLYKGILNSFNGSDKISLDDGFFNCTENGYYY